MSRIQTTFSALTRPALIGYLAAGDPDYDTSLTAMKALAANGADIIELGMPFTDPVADGPIIQAAALRALGAGATMQTTLQMVRDFRADFPDTPVVLMGYYNPVLRFGLDAFATATAEAGVDGFILVDLPPEEAGDFLTALAPYDLDLIRLITPTSDQERLPALLRDASGFLYYVSITGITGAAQADEAAVQAHITEIKKTTDLPIAIGFGIKTPEDVKRFAAIGDAVVVGSALVQTVSDHETTAAFKDRLSDQVRGLSGALSCS